MNERLIQDEGHSNAMTRTELESRMRGWLKSRTYDGALIEADGEPAGYALYRCEPEWAYVRHFFVERPFRRRGIGRWALEELERNHWSGARRIRLDVLAGNPDGIAFWRACGFTDYALTLERVLEDESGGDR